MGYSPLTLDRLSQAIEEDEEDYDTQGKFNEDEIGPSAVDTTSTMMGPLLHNDTDSTSSSTGNTLPANTTTSSSTTTYNEEDILHIVMDLDKNNYINYSDFASFGGSSSGSSNPNNNGVTTTFVDTPYEQDGSSNNFGIVLVGPGLQTPFGTSPHETHNSTSQQYEDRNWVVVGILIALIILLWFVLGVMLCVPLVRFVQRKMPVSKKRIERRYETIEGWLITKVRTNPFFESFLGYYCLLL